MFDYVFDHDKWEEFYDNFSSNEHVYKNDIKILREYIDNEKYLEILREYENTGMFPVPRLIMLSKKGTDKKRTVFSFDEDVSWILKFYGYFLHEYDGIFSDNLYSFRKERSVKTAVNRLINVKNLSQMYGVKLDIHDYFNSADTDIIIRKVKEVLEGQDKLVALFENILRNPGYISECRKFDLSDYDESSKETDSCFIQDNRCGLINDAVHKGMMAGSPLSPFLANLYLDELDKHFDSFNGSNGFYARYSDDIIFFTETKEELETEMDYVNQVLSKIKLTLNPDKVCFINQGETFEFLGFSYRYEESENSSRNQPKMVIDVSKASFEKIKKKLKRKSRAVLRWKVRKQIDAEKAARVYIKYFNRKFFENPVKSELTWCRWYFPVITTDTTLREIDHYMQECIRFLYTGKHTKRNYNLRYETIKELGYRSLVNEYHKNDGV